MKGAMGYLVITRLKAQVREVFKKPSRLIYLLLMLALFGFVLLGGSGETDVPARDARELPVLAGAFYGLMFVILVNSGFKNGASMFSLADVNLIFPAPIRPRTVLYYGLFRQLGTSLLLGVFLLFQYGWLHSLYGVGAGALVLIVVLYGVSVFLAQVAAMLAYSFTSASPRRRMIVKTCVYGVLAAFVLAVVARAALSGGLTLDSLVSAADSPLFRLMPVAGWTAGILRGAMTGDMLMLGFYVLLTAAVLIVMVVIIARYNHDFYEDVLRTAEISHSAITAQKEGRVADSAPANVKVGKTGLGGGWGASAIYFKHRLENRRARRWLLSPLSLVFAAVVIGFAAFMRDSGPLPVFMMAVYMQMFSEALSRFGMELTRPYIYLIPESAFAKLVAALRESIRGGLVESLVVFVPAGLLLGLDGWTIAALVLARWSFTLVYNADIVAEMRLFGGVSSKVLTLLFYFLLMLAIALPGIVAAIVLSALGVHPALCYAALAVLNVPMSLLALFLCRNMLQYAELNDQ